MHDRLMKGSFGFLGDRCRKTQRETDHVTDVMACPPDVLVSEHRLSLNRVEHRSIEALEHRSILELDEILS